MSYRSEFNEARKNNHWAAAEKIIGQLINLADVEDVEYDNLMKQKGEELADRMNKNDELARNLGKTI